MCTIDEQHFKELTNYLYKILSAFVNNSHSLHVTSLHLVQCFDLKVNARPGTKNLIFEKFKEQIRK